MEINNEFMEQHEGLVRRIVKQYHYPHIKEDLLQEGRLGLIEAAKRYTPETGVTFASYAAWWIHKWIKEGVRQYAFVMVLPNHIEGKSELETVELDTPQHEEGGDIITLADILADVSMREAVTRKDMVEDLMNGSGLTPREKVAIRMFYGLDERAKSMEEVAELVGLRTKGGYALVERAIQKIAKKLQKNAGGCRKRG